LEERKPIIGGDLRKKGKFELRKGSSSKDLLEKVALGISSNSVQTAAQFQGKGARVGERGGAK